MFGKAERVEQRRKLRVGAAGAASRTLSSTLRQGSSRGSWNAIAMVRSAGWWTEPEKSSSSPATIRIGVDLPQPEGPISAAVSPGRSENAKSAMIRRSRLAPRGRFCGRRSPRAGEFASG